MPANFTSGWLGNGERAWHGEGVVTDGTLPAREAFETADALFDVEKRELFYLTDPVPPCTSGTRNSDVYGVVRTDTQALLGVVSKQYELVQNDALLRMAEFIREEADMDSVVVLADGAKVAFTATLRGAEADIVAGDKVKRRLVGYLGHDGKTGCGAKFTDIRVVCQNTLAAALGDTGAHSSITHKNGANANFNALIQSINTARQSFDDQCALMREFTRVSMGQDAFDEYVDSVYGIEEGDKFRKRDKLRNAFFNGMGANYAPMSLWNGVNAITQVETSTRNQTRAGEKRQFARANFGAGLVMSRKAMQVAELMLATC
tara:strand:- start:6138 stop:7091 length:954 start_codon:yes stop_codon:yes gene_type:complete